MTTLVGLTTNKKYNTVVLASDLCKTSVTWQSQGDLVYQSKTKTETQKIYTDPKGNFAFCMSGRFDAYFIDLMHGMLDGKIDVKEVVSKGFFEELHKINMCRWNYQNPESDRINGLLIATRYEGKPELHTCWPLGKVEPREWTSIGSGSSYASRYIVEQGTAVPPHLTPKQGVDLAVASLDMAEHDIYTGGLDLVVVTPDEIVPYGKQIKEALDAAKEKAIKGIKRDLVSRLKK